MRAARRPAAARRYPTAPGRRGTTHPTAVPSSVRDWLGRGAPARWLLLRHHDAFTFEADLEAGVVDVFDHHVLERLVVHHLRDEVAGPGDERVRGDRQRIFARDAQRKRLDRR